LVDKRSSTRILVRLWDHGRLLLDVIRTPILLSVTIAGNAILFTGAFLFYLVERGTNPAVKTFFDGLWWAFCTVTTVGYGDVTPVTTLGRLIGICMMIGGVASFVSFTAFLVSIVTARAAGDILGYEAKEARELHKITRALEGIQERLGKLEEQTRQ
jgi:voltage-gated potassium channel